MKNRCLFLLILWCLLVIFPSLTWYTLSSKRVPLYQALPDLNYLIQNLTHTSNRNSINGSIPTVDQRMQSLVDFCNIPGNTRTPSLEGNIQKGYNLIGVVTVFRHGDRGPLAQLKSKTRVNCSSHTIDVYRKYERDVRNLGSKGIAEKLIPISDFCLPGLLTKQGSSQLLELGQILKHSYSNYVNFSNSTDFSNINAFTTPYSRTIQSIYSFLYGLIGPTSLLRVKIQSRSQVSFCFKHCRCSATERHEKLHKKELIKRISRDPFFKYNFTEQILPLKREMVKSSSVELPSTIRDIALYYICHDLTFPWFGTENTFHAQMLLESLKREAHTSSLGINLKKAAVLRTYGLLSYLNQKIEQWISTSTSLDNAKQRKPMFIFFSGHDLTLVYMLATLGIYDGYLPNYASRITIEVLQNGTQYYVRVLWDGRDVTSLVCPQKLTVYCDASFLVRILEFSLKSHFGTTNFGEACEA